MYALVLKYAHDTFFLVRCRCSTLVLMISSSFTPSSRRYPLQGIISTSCFCCFCGAALSGWCDRIWILPSRSMLLTSRGKKEVGAVCGFSFPSCLCRLLLFILFSIFFASPLPLHTSLSRASTRWSTFNSSAAIARTWWPPGAARLKLTFSAVPCWRKNLRGCWGKVGG